MDCDVIRDLIPLYLDDCASAASARMVEAHTAQCPGCRACLERSGGTLPQVQTLTVPAAGQVGQWRASMLQSALFLMYFGILTVGVAKEAATPHGLLNGFWGCSVVVPAAGFLLGLVNWYFVRVYPSRRSFVAGSVVCTALTHTGAFALALWHYAFPPVEFLVAYSLRGWLFVVGNLLLSGVLSWLYARLIGKE